MEHALRAAGLTEHETRIYLALLKIGSTTAGQLIKMLGMHRAAVYDTLDLLVEKGLVAFVMQANRKHFEAHDPERLMEYLESRKRRIEHQKKLLRKDIRRLRAMRSISREPQEGCIYKGKKGITSVCEDVLREGKEWLVIGSQGTFPKLLPAYFAAFHRRRVRLGIPMKIILNEGSRHAAWSAGLIMREERFLPDAMTAPSTTFVYSNRIAIIVWSPEPMAFLVRGRTVADAYRRYFGVLWKGAKAQDPVQLIAGRLSAYRGKITSVEMQHEAARVWLKKGR